jgi:hypothetical protein
LTYIYMEAKSLTRHGKVRLGLNDGDSEIDAAAVTENAFRAMRVICLDGTGRRGISAWWLIARHHLRGARDRYAPDRERTNRASAGSRLWHEAPLVLAFRHDR